MTEWWPPVAPPALRASHARLQGWLFQSALPLWWDRGADRQGGGFFERIGQDGRVVEAPRRIRVVGRQIFSYATALRLGWTGPGAQAVDHGLTFLLDKGRAPDRTFFSEVAADGRALRDDFDLYDQAFALFGLAAAARVRPDGHALAAIAAETLAEMRRGWAHPLGGFREGRPHRPTLLANPHMHLFEASLAWLQSGVAADLAPWHALADEMAGLCLARFLHPATGALREYYGPDWHPAAGEAGRIIEPGHHFEWAWLLLRWGRLRNRPDAVAAARRLARTAEEHGVDARRNTVHNEMLDDFTLRDPRTRLWHQTERMKAWLALAEGDPALWPQAVEKVAAAVDGLMGFCATPVPGLWHDILLPDGSHVPEDARASSLYHIVCAFEELDRAVQGRALGAAQGADLRAELGAELQVAHNSAPDYAGAAMQPAPDRRRA